MKAETINKCKILIGCFVQEILINGTARLSSIYFVESKTRYNVDSQQASFPFVLTYMIKNLSGPVIGYIEQILGTKWIITIGSLLATLAIGGCFFAEDILVITILWGVMLGLSFGLAQNMIPPLLNRCFINSKSIANAFASSGSCVGGIILPVIATASIKSYGTSGSFLVLSAVLAHTIPASLLIRSCNIKHKTRTLKAAIVQENDAEFKNHKNTIEISSVSHSFDKRQTCKCLTNCVSDNGSYKTPSNTNNYTEKMVNHTKEIPAYDSYFSSTMHKEISTKKQVEHLEESKSRNKKFTFRYFKIFVDPTFIAILCINGLNTTLITSLWTIILDFVKLKGVSESLEIYYVMLLPVTELFGRFFSGYGIDKGILALTNFCLITFLTEAVLLVAFVYCSNYILLMVCEMFISFCIGMTVIMEIMVTHVFIEENARKMAMSCRLILYAPLSFIISPMIGYFRGGYGSYDYIFYILSALSVVCGCSAYLLPYLAKSRGRADVAEPSQKDIHIDDI